nr:hypothetical protein CFP56_10489 [Quercus suber]
MRGFVLLVDVVSPEPPNIAIANPWISNAGVTITLKTNRLPSTTCSASPRAAGCRVLAISQSKSSTSTVDKPMLVENTRLASFCADGFFIRYVGGLNASFRNHGSPSRPWPLLSRASLESAGNNFCCATATATSHVNTNGIEEKMMVEAETVSSRRRCSRDAAWQSVQPGSAASKMAAIREDWGRAAAAAAAAAADNVLRAKALGGTVCAEGREIAMIQESGSIVNCCETGRKEIVKAGEWTRALPAGMWWCLAYVNPLIGFG